MSLPKYHVMVNCFSKISRWRFFKERADARGGAKIADPSPRYQKINGISFFTFLYIPNGFSSMISSQARSISSSSSF